MADTDASTQKSKAAVSRSKIRQIRERKRCSAVAKDQLGLKT